MDKAPPCTVRSTNCSVKEELNDRSGDAVVVLLYKRMHTLLVVRDFLHGMKLNCRCSGSRDGQRSRSRTCGYTATDELVWPSCYDF
ncbi:hypothetical protein D3C75_1182480 [compost metagenome]